MFRRSFVIAVLVLAVASLLAIAQKTPIIQVRPWSLREPGFYLVGNIEEGEATIEADKGRQRTSFTGSIGFHVLSQKKGAHQVVLSRLNLVSKGLRTERGETGVIGVSLAEDGFKLEYSPRTGEVAGGFETILHYELIDRVRGYRQQEQKGELDTFAPYTERMIGKLWGKFRTPLEPAEKGSTQFEGDITLELSSPVLGVIRYARLRFLVVVDWIAFQAADVLRIQPVFIGSGPSDPNATGTAFSTLMNHAREIWNRCGSVRCIKFIVNDPIYVNNDAYRVLDNTSEANNLRAEVNVTNAVEVFLAERMATSLA
jgi:hypothetical protein